MGLVVGIDLGTQSLKVVVCDDDLVVRGEHAMAYAIRHPAPGRAEQDPGDWERALAPAVGAALAAAGASAEDIAAIAVAGQLDGCVAIDANGDALHPALIWQDRRAVAEVLGDGTITAAQLFAITGQVADPGHFAPKVRWLRAHGIAAMRFHQPTTYLVERLTGVAVIDPALASTTMLFDLATHTWSQRLLDAFAIDSRTLPEVHATYAPAGVLSERGARLTGLRAGTPVAVGTGDDFATPLGAGLTPGRVVCAIGTAEVVGAIAATRIDDRASEPMVETHAYPGGGFFVENPGWLSGGAVRWATRLLGIADDAELDALAAAAPPGSGGVTFIPALAGAMTPVWRPHATATFHGLVAGHDRTHVARAVLEGVAFACRDVVERLAALGLPTGDVLIVGGGARSRVWTQLRADVLGRPHQVGARTDTCPIGAAMIAAVAAGYVPDLPTAATLVPPATETFAPDPAAPADEAYRRYQRLVATLAPLQTSPWITDEP